MLKTKVIFIICIFLGSLSMSSPIFWPHSLNLSSKKSVFFQKPDIGNSWPWVVSHVSASPSCRDFTFKVKAKITTQLSQMKANERARKLEKSSNSIFINALAYWFQWIQVYFPILSNPAPCIELCRAGERVSKSHSQCLSLAWPLWCSMSVGRELNPTEFSFLKCRMELLAGLTSLDSWEDELQ